MFDDDLALQNVVCTKHEHCQTGTDRIFDQAQAMWSPPLALSAWGVTNTFSAIATPLSPGMEDIPPPQSESMEVSYSELMTLGFASIGKDRRDAAAGYTINDTSAQGVPTNLTELKSVLVRRSRQALTPYNPDVWEEFLSRTGLY
jgi:hypothetical protein